MDLKLWLVTSKKKFRPVGGNAGAVVVAQSSQDARIIVGVMLPLPVEAIYIGVASPLYKEGNILFINTTDY